MERLDVRTRARNEFVEITDLVCDAVRRSGVLHGIAVVYCPHTTAGLTINENADPDVVHDILAWLDHAVPQVQPFFRHGEGNSDAHIKASWMGSSVTLLIDGATLQLGRWQGVYLCEFDGPRTRQVWIDVRG
ncbi:MAG: secondary thiamine-phosphate synthase enzyme YjbQ [Gemmataceae bacterium]